MGNLKVDLYYTLEKINELEATIKAAETAKEDLKIYEENFKDLCKQVIGEEEKC